VVVVVVCVCVCVCVCVMPRGCSFPAPIKRIKLSQRPVKSRPIPSSLRADEVGRMAMLKIRGIAPSLQEETTHDDSSACLCRCFGAAGVLHRPCLFNAYFNHVFDACRRIGKGLV
jgi:hypothetical protein